VSRRQAMLHDNPAGSALSWFHCCSDPDFGEPRKTLDGASAACCPALGISQPRRRESPSAGVVNRSCSEIKPEQTCAGEES